MIWSWPGSIVTLINVYISIKWTLRDENLSLIKNLLGDYLGWMFYTWRLYENFSCLEFVISQTSGDSPVWPTLTGVKIDRWKIFTMSNPSLGWKMSTGLIYNAWVTFFKAQWSKESNLSVEKKVRNLTCQNVSPLVSSSPETPVTTMCLEWIERQWYQARSDLLQYSPGWVDQDTLMPLGTPKSKSKPVLLLKMLCWGRSCSTRSAVDLYAP